MLTCPATALRLHLHESSRFHSVCSSVCLSLRINNWRAGPGVPAACALKSGSESFDRLEIHLLRFKQTTQPQLQHQHQHQARQIFSRLLPTIRLTKCSAACARTPHECGSTLKHTAVRWLSSRLHDAQLPTQATSWSSSCTRFRRCTAARAARRTACPRRPRSSRSAAPSCGWARARCPPPRGRR